MVSFWGGLNTKSRREYIYAFRPQETLIVHTITSLSHPQYLSEDDLHIFTTLFKAGISHN